MLDFEFYSPTKFFFGKEQECRVGEIINTYQIDRVLLHSGGSSAEKSGLLSRVRESLEKANIVYFELSDVVANPRLDKVREGIQICKENAIELILAVGGGSVVDSAKAIALGACYEGDVWDFYAQKAVAQRALKVATIITLAATGSEASNSTVITNTDNEEKWLKTGYNTDLVRPCFSIMNPSLLFTLPKMQIAAGIVDILSHSFERYITNTQDVDFTDRMLEALMQSVLLMGRRVMENPSDYDAQANLMWAGTLSHSNILGVGREQDWASHQIEHQVSAFNDLTHGAGLAIVIPAFMQYTLQTNVKRYYQFATNVMGVSSSLEDMELVAKEGIFRLKQYFKSLGLAVSLTEVSIKEEDLPSLIVGIKKNNKGEKVGFFQPLDEEDIFQLLRLAL